MSKYKFILPVTDILIKPLFYPTGRYILSDGFSTYDECIIVVDSGGSIVMYDVPRDNYVVFIKDLKQYVCYDTVGGWMHFGHKDEIEEYNIKFGIKNKSKNEDVLVWENGAWIK